ncbi:MAG: hypothetical protein Q7S69_08195 [Nitrosomonadaceae bacterium]|nr:hypothetical protein [Nitrosomonadaceae bacterium]
MFAATFCGYLFGVSLKHEGFGEEREWRVLYAPKLLHSPLMEQVTETIGGIPQIINKLPLDVSVSDVLADLDFACLFDRIIIGPSPYPLVQRGAFVDALKEAGVPDAEKHVVMSDIPIRT